MILSTKTGKRVKIYKRNKSLNYISAIKWDCSKEERHLRRPPTCTE